jgi:hypothetical protein
LGLGLDVVGFLVSSMMSSSESDPWSICFLLEEELVALDLALDLDFLDLFVRSTISSSSLSRALFLADFLLGTCSLVAEEDAFTGFLLLVCLSSLSSWSSSWSSLSLAASSSSLSLSSRI